MIKEGIIIKIVMSGVVINTIKGVKVNNASGLFSQRLRIV